MSQIPITDTNRKIPRFFSGLTLLKKHKSFQDQSRRNQTFKEMVSLSWWSESMTSVTRQTPVHSSPRKLSLSTSISFPLGILSHRNNRRSNLLSLCGLSSTQPISSTLKRRRTKYRKQYPGEKVGITEEMRFVAMRLRNANGKKLDVADNDDTESEKEVEQEEEDDGNENWKPTMDGLLHYLVDTKLVFETIERIVDESEDVSYAYFRRTGLERCQSLERDLEWFTSQNMVIPEPSQVGIAYAKYLEQQAKENAPLFLAHFYNIYFSHIAAGQVLVRQVCEKLLEGKELEFNRWEGDNAQDLLRGVREKLNVLGEHWTRDEKNKCLKETAKAYKYMGQIVRLIIL